MRKIRKRVFEAVLAAALFFTMPGMAFAAEAEVAQTEDISESVAEQENADGTEQTVADDTEDSAEETETIQEPEAEDGDTDQPGTGEDDTGDTATEEQEPVEGEQELTTDEQEQSDILPCLELQEQLDETNVPASIDESTEGAVAVADSASGITYYGDIDTAWTAAQGKTATVTLLADVTASGTLTVDTGSTITLKGGDYTLTSGQGTAIQVNGTLKLESGTVKSTYSSMNARGINVSGTLEMTGGAVTASNSYISGSMAVRADSDGSITVSGGKITGVYGILVNGGTVTIQNGEISGQSRAVDINTGTVTIEGGTFTGSVHYGLNVAQNGTAVLRGGTFTGNMYAINSKTALSDLLDKTQPGAYYAYFENGKPVALEDGQTSLPGGTYTVGECNHEGGVQDQGNGTHGGDCPYCGAKSAEEPHTLGADNKCEGCGTPLKVQVEIGNATTYYGTIDAAWEAVEGATSAEITLLDHVTTNYLCGPVSGQNITFNGGNFEYTSTQALLSVAGHLTVNSGIFIATGGGQVALHVGPGGTATLNGGTFTGTGGSYWVAIGSQQTPVSEFLAEGCAYYRNGKPIEMTGQTYLEGTVTVQECHHEGVKATPNNDGTHSLKCPYCGYTEAAEPCTYGTEYQHNDINHWQICTVCGYQKTEMHTLNLKQGDTVNGVTQNREACDCGFFNAFTVTVTVPSGLTYGNTGGKRVAYTVNPVKSGDAEWELTDMQGKVLEMEDDTLPANLTAGDYRLWIYGSNDSKYVFVGTTIFTVSPATLTANMVTLSPESVGYNGAEQKPTITVKQGETTLTEGTDYEVSYSRNGAATTDFTNAGTVMITVNGKGNYDGKVVKTFTIARASLTIKANDQEITFGQDIAEGFDNMTVTGLCMGDSLKNVTLTPSTANVPGGVIIPSAAVVRNANDQNVTGNYQIAYQNGVLTIIKAAAAITVGTAAYDKTYGDQTFALDVTDDNQEADVQCEVTEGTDVVSVSDGTVTILNAGTASITVSLPESANYNAAGSKTITVNVAKKEGYTVDEINNSYYFDKQSTARINLAGLLPEDCGAVSYGAPTTAGDVTYSVEPVVNGKELSYTVDKGSADEKGTITVVAVTRNYADITVTVVITRSSCDHVAKEELFYTGKGEKAPTCTEGGFGHRECAECGAVIESGVLAAALGHDYRGEVTTEPTVSAEGEKTYICVRCGDTYTETVPRRPEGLWISGLEQSYSYTGSAIRPGGIRVYHGATLLREKTDYTISYKNNTKAGAAQIIVTGKGSYKGKAAADFTIEAVDLRTDPNISYNITTVMETGKNLKPTLTVSWKGKKLKEKTDYTLSYEANIKTASAEGYDVTITGKGNYTGAIVEKFYVAPKGTPLLSKATVKGLAKSYPYCENRIPEGLEAALENLTVKVGKTTLTKEDYTVRLENVSAVGTGTVVIEAAPGSMYAGQKRVTFSITGTSLKNGSIIGLEKTYPYTGSPVEPRIEVYSGKKGAGEQIPSDSYTVSYSNSIGNGKAKVTVTGIAAKGCSGSLAAAYTIGKLSIADDGVTVEMPDTIEYAKGGAKPQPVITHTHDGRAAILREGVDYTLKYSNNTSAGGTKKPTVKITGTGNYSGTVTKEYEITGQDIGRLAITAADKPYNSKKKGSYYYSAPKVYDLDGKLLKSGIDYTVQYFDASTGQEISKNDAVAQGTEIRVTATGKGSYRGALSGIYRVLAAGDVKDIGKAKNEKVANQPYTGAGIRPAIRLYTMTGKTRTDLAEGTDYEIIGFYNNIKKGTATVLIRGKGAYSGVKCITFKIVAVDNGSIWKGVF